MEVIKPIAMKGGETQTEDIEILKAWARGEKQTPDPTQTQKERKA